MIAIVVALYVFVGNSGVISFGHVSFVAVGAYLAGVLTVDPADEGVHDAGPLSRPRATAHIGTVPSLALAAAAGGIYALAVGLPLMRLSGLPAGIATFAVLGITYNVLYYWQKVGPTAQTLSDIPETRTLDARGAARSSPSSSRTPTSAAGSGGCCARRARIRRPRARPASRSTGSACSASRSAARSPGSPGGLYVHELGLITPDLFYLDLTFVTLAMLVFGGVGSLWGAVLGALAISALNSFLGDAENTVHVGFRLTLPDGTRLVTIGARDGARDHPAPVRV